MNVVLYLRRSDERQEASIRDQRTALKKYAADKKYRIVGEYVDDGISGDATEKRVAFLKMVHDAPTATWKTVLCWDQDRFGRFDSVEAGYYLYPLRKSGVVLETIAQGRIDWTDFAGRLIYTVQQEAKHAYLRDLSRNVARAMTTMASEGKHLCVPPFGYERKDKTLAPHPKYAKFIKKMFQLYLDGYSTEELGAWLDAQGVPTVHGAPWAKASVRCILANEAYCGVAIWNRRSKSRYGLIDAGREIRVENAHPAIIDRATFDAVRAESKRRQKRTSPIIAQRRFALSGVIFCGKCGHAMQGRTDPKGRSWYVCGGASSHRTCLMNWTLEQTLVEKMHALFLAMADKKMLAMVREQVLNARRQEPQQSQSSIASRLATAESQLAKARSRLLEVDRDMLAIVQDKIRTLTQEVSTLKAAAPPVPVAVAVEQVVSSMKSVSERVGKATPEDIGKQLRGFIERIEVHINARAAGSKYWFTFSHAILKMTAGGELRVE